jgi:hypothetical protein
MTAGGCSEEGQSVGGDFPKVPGAGAAAEMMQSTVQKSRELLGVLLRARCFGFYQLCDLIVVDRRERMTRYICMDQTRRDWQGPDLIIGIPTHLGYGRHWRCCSGCRQWTEDDAYGWERFPG